MRNAPSSSGRPSPAPCGTRRMRLSKSQPRMKTVRRAFASAERTAEKYAAPSIRKASRPARSMRQQLRPGERRLIVPSPPALCARAPRGLPGVPPLAPQLLQPRDIELGEIRHDRVRPGVLERARIAAAVDADDEAEAPTGCGLHARNRVLEHDRLPGRRAERLGALQEHVRMGLSPCAQCLLVVAVETRVEKSREPRELEDLAAVAARGDEPGAHATRAERLHQRDSGGERLHAALVQAALEER